MLAVHGSDSLPDVSLAWIGTHWDARNGRDVGVAYDQLGYTVTHSQ